MNNIPVSKAPYTRGYNHHKGRGSESTVLCSFCGRKVPRYKTITAQRGFRINDTAILQAIDDKRSIHMFSRKQYACPACARHRNIVKKRGV